MVVFASNVKLI